jgi:prolyl oligopeptidase
VPALQRPDLFRAAVPRVAVLNPTHLEAMANGPNQYAEMGDPRTEAGFRALAKQDAVLQLQERLRANPQYVPPALFVTLGLNDQRVSPWMPAKFAATALAQAGSRSPVFVRSDGTQGHGVGSAVGGVVQEWADTFAFLEAVLGTRP